MPEVSFKSLQLKKAGEGLSGRLEASNKRANFSNKFQLILKVYQYFNRGILGIPGNVIINTYFFFHWNQLGDYYPQDQSSN